jgi:nucleotide-binding universal stress UspA family protein
LPEQDRAARADAGRRFKRLIGRARAQAGEAGAELHVHVVAGHAVSSIVELVEKEHFDLLIVGFMGHSALYNRLIGSTTDRLVELARCPVLVVK